MQKPQKHFDKVVEAVKYFVRIIQILACAGKLYLVTIVLLAIAFGIIPSISVLVMQEIVNTLQTSIRSFEQIVVLIIVYIGIDFLGGVLGLISGYVENMLQMKAAITLDMSVLEKVKELNLRDFEDSETYNLIQRAMGTGISRLFSFFKSFVLFFQSLISLVMFSIILLSWKWWLLPLVFVMPIINTFVSAHFGKKQFIIQKNRAGESRKQWYFQYLLTNDIAFKEIKTFNLGGYFRSKHKQISLDFLKQDKHLLKRRTRAQFILLVIDQAISAAMFVFVITTAFVGKILLGELITYTRSISNIKSSSQGLLSHINSIYQNVLYISQYFDFIDMNTDTGSKGEGEGLILDAIPSIKISNLSYRYKDKDVNALSNININIEGNSLIAFIGKNGSGKTTLVKILSALYNNYEGDVCFGERNLRDIGAEEVRKKIGLLFQDFVKYELSVKENVAFGQLDSFCDDNAIIQALLKTGMQDRVEGLETQLGSWFDSGVQLSGGEWLRIALSRAFIRDAELYLLDEPNSALDSVSEKQVLNSFKELARGKIGIIVSHRIASIKNIVDKIIVFDSGSIDACGTHDELLRTSKVYRELYEQENGIG